MKPKKLTATAVTSPPMPTYKVLVSRKDGSGYEFIEVTWAQYCAYAQNKPGWRKAK